MKGKRKPRRKILVCFTMSRPTKEKLARLARRHRSSMSSMVGRLVDAASGDSGVPRAADLDSHTVARLDTDFELRCIEDDTVWDSMRASYELESSQRLRMGLAPRDLANFVIDWETLRQREEQRREQQAIRETFAGNDAASVASRTESLAMEQRPVSKKTSRRREPRTQTRSRRASKAAALVGDDPPTPPGREGGGL